MQIVRLLHQRRRHGGVDLRRGQPLVPHLLLDHGHRHAGHQRIHHMAMPEDMWCDLLPGKLLPGRDFLDPGLLCQAVYSPENRLGAQVARAPAGKEPLLARLQTLPDGLQSGLFHPGGPKATGLGPAALDSDEPVIKSMSETRVVTSSPLCSPDHRGRGAPVCLYLLQQRTGNLFPYYLGT